MNESLQRSYKKGLRFLQGISLLVQGAFFLLRINLLKEFSIICSIEIFQILILSLMMCQNRPVLQCKVYIIIGILILIILLYNLLATFTVFEDQKNLYIENFSQNYKRVMYPIELILRSVIIMVVWRNHEFSIFKNLHQSRFHQIQSDSEI